MSVSEMSVSQMSVSQMSVGQMSIGQMFIGQMFFNPKHDCVSRNKSNWINCQIKTEIVSIEEN